MIEIPHDEEGLAIMHEERAKLESDIVARNPILGKFSMNKPLRFLRETWSAYACLYPYIEGEILEKIINKLFIQPDPAQRATFREEGALCHWVCGFVVCSCLLLSCCQCWIRGVVRDLCYRVVVTLVPSPKMRTGMQQ